MRSAILFLVAALLPAQTPAPPIDPNEVVLTIGDRKITAAQYEKLIRTLLPAEQQAYALGPGRRQMAQKLVEMSILAEEAARRGIDKQPDAAAAIGLQKQKVLASAVFSSLVDAAVVPDADVQAYYDSHRSDFEVVTARHILVRVKGSPLPAPPDKPELSDEEARAKAEAIRARIVAGGGGEDFAKVAKEESDDTGSRTQGGELGEIRRNKTVQQFEQAAFALKPGEISQPVKTPYGYHIIQVQTHSVRNLADVKPDIVAQLKPGIARKTVEGIMNGTKFNIDDSFFGPDPQAAASGGAKP